jgi:hypothetical protein
VNSSAVFNCSVCVCVESNEVGIASLRLLLERY